VSTFRPSFSPQSKVYPQPFDSCNPCAPKSPFVFNRLRTLYLSCRSFCDSCPLFSMTSALFDKNTGGRYPGPVFGLSAGVDEDSQCRRRNHGTLGLTYLRHLPPQRLSSSRRVAKASTHFGCDSLPLHYLIYVLYFAHLHCAYLPLESTLTKVYQNKGL